jgi:hypothetical protein
MQIARCALWYIVVGSPLEYLPCVVYRTMLMGMIEHCEPHSKVLQGVHDDYNSFNNRQ